MEVNSRKEKNKTLVCQLEAKTHERYSLSYFLEGCFPPHRKRSAQYFSSNRLIVTPFELDACMKESLSRKIPTWFVEPPALLLKNTKSPSLSPLSEGRVLQAFSMSWERRGNFMPYTSLYTMDTKPEQSTPCLVSPPLL